MAKQEYPSKGTYLFYRFIETDKTFNEVIDIINGSKDFIPDADAALLKLNVLRESCKQAHLALYANHDSINMVNIGFNDLSPLTDDVAVECNHKYVDLNGPVYCKYLLLHATHLHQKLVATNASNLQT